MVLSFLVVVDELDVSGTGGAPGEADPPLVVYTNAVLAGAAAAELFQPVAGWDTKVVDALGGVDENELVVWSRLSTGLSLLM
jgi:hypothetical protein